MSWTGDNRVLPHVIVLDTSPVQAEMVSAVRRALNREYGPSRFLRFGSYDAAEYEIWRSGPDRGFRIAAYTLTPRIRHYPRNPKPYDLRYELQEIEFDEGSIVKADPNRI